MARRGLLNPLPPAGRGRLRTIHVNGTISCRVPMAHVWPCFPSAQRLYLIVGIRMPSYVRLVYTEHCDFGYHFPIGIPIYRFRTEISVPLVFGITAMSSDVWMKLHSRSRLLSHFATATILPLPYERLVSALHPTSVTTSTVPALGLVALVLSPQRQ